MPKKVLGITCADPRIRKGFKNHIKGQFGGLTRDEVIIITLFGGCLNFVDSAHDFLNRSVLHMIKIGVEVLGVTDVMLANHTKCRAYLSMANSEIREIELHEAHVREAGQVISQCFPEITVHHRLIRLNHDGIISSIDPILNQA